MTNETPQEIPPLTWKDYYSNPGSFLKEVPGSNGEYYLPKVKLVEDPKPHELLPKIPSPQPLLNLDPVYPGNIKGTVYGVEYGNRFSVDGSILEQLLSDPKKLVGAKQGGSSTIVFGRDTWIKESTEKSIGIKFLTDKQIEKYYLGSLQRFFVEARVLANLQHPHLLKVHDITLLPSVETGRVLPGIIMERITGGNLDELEDKKLSYREITDVVDQLAEVLDYLNSQGLKHYDVSEANILIRERTNTKIDVVLADLGTVTRMSSVSEKLAYVPDISIHTPLGHLLYAAPEQGRTFGKHYDDKSISSQTEAIDRYSLAKTAYYLLCDTLGREYFAKNNPPHSFDITPIEELPDSVNEVLKKGTAHKPADRYPSCEAFSMALKKALNEAEFDKLTSFDF